MVDRSRLMALTREATAWTRPSADGPDGRSERWRSGIASAGAVRAVAAPIIVTRTLVLAVITLAMELIATSPWAPSGKVVPGLLGGLTRWDANHYVAIARDGYAFGSPEIAFSPLYPVLIRTARIGLWWLPREMDPYRVAAVVVANIAMVVTCLLLAELARTEGDDRMGSRAVWALLVFPTSLFLSVAYAESVFLALTIGTAVAVGRDRWLLAGVLGALAALWRPQGVLIVALIGLEAFVARDRIPRRRAAVAVALPLLALLGWMAWQGMTLGDPLAFVNVQDGWGRGATTPWDTLARFFAAPPTLHSGLHSLVDLGFTVVAAGLVAAAWRTERWPLAAYATLLLLAPLLTGTLLSMPRFALGIFPIFLVLGRLMSRPTAERTVITVGGGGLAVCATLYAGYYWVA
jgi:hypothetical protein